MNVKNGNGEFHNAFEYQNEDFEMRHTLTHFYNKKKDSYWKNILANAPHFAVNFNGCGITVIGQ